MMRDWGNLGGDEKGFFQVVLVSFFKRVVVYVIWEGEFESILMLYYFYCIMCSVLSLDSSLPKREKSQSYHLLSQLLSSSLVLN